GCARTRNRDPAGLRRRRPLPLAGQPALVQECVATRARSPDRARLCCGSDGCAVAGAAERPGFHLFPVLEGGRAIMGPTPTASLKTTAWGDVPAPRPGRRQRQQGRAAVLWGLAFFGLAQIALGAFIEWRRPDLRDPTFEIRYQRLSERMACAGAAPIKVIFLEIGR